MTAVSIVAASAAGWAILALAVLVLYHMDLRTGRYIVAAGWCGAALAGAYLGLVPGVEMVAPHWSVVVIAISAAIGGWISLEALLEQATAPARIPTAIRAAVFASAAGAAATVAITPAMASREPGLQMLPVKERTPSENRRATPMG